MKVLSNKMFRLVFAGLMCTQLSMSIVQAGDLVMPPLPGGASGAGMPPLPSIISSVPLAAADIGEPKNWSANGFVEARAGARLQDDPYQGDGTLAEARMQWELEYSAEKYTARIRTDFLFDAESDDHRIALNQGSGAVDLRETWLQTALTQWLDVKAGRQILTWGVGDQLFINDLFPKDWNSFFIGRDMEYLKAPSDAVKLAFYFDVFNVDLVWTPEFDSDRYIDGNPISFYNPQLGRHSGSDVPVAADLPNGDEIALRLYKNIGGVEYAGYFYDGFWKSPNSVDAFSGEVLMPQLRVIGASVRVAVAGGIFSGEVGQYKSRDDSDGTDAYTANSETRLLLGFETELASDLTGGVQYYVERLGDYSGYKKSLFSGLRQRDKYRQLITTRLTYLTMNQNLEWSLFVFVSPTDEDYFLQPKVSYKYSDRLLLTTGFNIFDGEDNRSFFGQFADSSNVYAGVRYSF